MINESRWTILEIYSKKTITEFRKNPINIKRAIVVCLCGSIRDVLFAEIKRGKSKSCGCLGRELSSIKHTKHGLSTTKFYNVWRAMIARCHKPKNCNYRFYGARGVAVCLDWHKFENFRDDMISSYKEGLQIDRINCFGSYNKENCRWTNTKVQSSNKRKPITNTTGVVGVHKQKKDNSYGVTYTLNNKKNNKYFSINKYGEELAFKMACDFRKKYIEIKNKEGYEFRE